MLNRTIDGFGTFTMNHTTDWVSGIVRALVILQPVEVTYGPPLAKLIVFVITAAPAVPLPPFAGGFPSTLRLLL